MGLLDADIYGPSIPTMMKLHEKPEVSEGGVLLFSVSLFHIIILFPFCVLTETMLSELPLCLQPCIVGYRLGMTITMYKDITYPVLTVFSIENLLNFGKIVMIV